MLAVLGHFYFYINFRLSLSISTKTAGWELDWRCTEPMNVFREGVILTKLSLPCVNAPCPLIYLGRPRLILARLSSSHVEFLHIFVKFIPEIFVFSHYCK